MVTPGKTGLILVDIWWFRFKNYFCGKLRRSEEKIKRLKRLTFLKILSTLKQGNDVLDT